MITGSRKYKTPLEAIQGKYQVTSSGCWEWAKGLSDGYGTQAFNGKFYKAATLSLMAYTTLVPLGSLDVCHTCNNRKCINPEHLYLGTRSMNVRQAVREGTISKKLSPRKVQIIYGLIRSKKPGVRPFKFNKIVGELFGVSYKLIEMISNGKAWSEVTGVRPQ